MIIRPWSEHHKCSVLFSDLLKFLKRYRASCDEVWFCTELGFPSLDVYRCSAEQMAFMAERVRDVGFGAGIHVANTLGMLTYQYVTL